MNQVITWLEKASHKLAILLITLAFLTSAIALSFAPSAVAQSLVANAPVSQTNENTGSWTRSPLPKEKTRQAPPDSLNADNLKNDLKKGVRDTADNVRDTLNLNQPLIARRGYYNQIRNRPDNVTNNAVGNPASNAVENTKNAFGGIGEDVRDTIKDATEPVQY